MNGIITTPRGKPFQKDVDAYVLEVSGWLPQGDCGVAPQVFQDCRRIIDTVGKMQCFSSL